LACGARRAWRRRTPVELGVGRGIRRGGAGNAGRIRRPVRIRRGAGGADKAAGARNPRGRRGGRRRGLGRVRAGHWHEEEEDPDRWGPSVSSARERVRGGLLCAPGGKGKSGPALLGRRRGEKGRRRGKGGERWAGAGKERGPRVAGLRPAASPARGRERRR
jgi:hypothetical protein